MVTPPQRRPASAADPAQRQASLRALAEALQQQVQRGELTDLEALARLAERRAALATSASLAERWRFVCDLTSLLTDLDLSRLPPRRHRRYVAFGERGFRPAYRSRDQGSRNQVRHAVGFMAAGFVLTAPAGAALSVLLEVGSAVARRRPVDWPDAWLGCRGAALGAAIRRGALPLDGTGDWLRRALGEPDAAGP